MGRSLPLWTAGYSMWPLVRPDTWVLVRPCEPVEVRCGDVVLLATATEPVLHRVIRAGPDAVLTKGDAVRHPDGWIAREAIVGRLERRLWDGWVARASPYLARPLALALRLWRGAAR